MKGYKSYNRVFEFLSPPTFEDGEKTRIASLINTILAIIAVGSLFFLIFSGFALVADRLIVTLSLGTILIAGVLKLVLQQGYIKVAGSLLSLTVWTCFTIPMLVFDGLRDVAVTGYFLAIAITSLLLGGRTLFVFILLASISLAAAYWAEINGSLTTSFQVPPSQIDLVTILITLNITAIFTHFTVRRMIQSERTMRVERDKAQQYLDITGTIIIALDIQNNITLINRWGCQILECKENNIIGKNWFDHFLPEDIKEQVRADFEKLISGETEGLMQYENAIITKSGQERIITWSNTLLKDDVGNIIGTLSSGEDITERILAARQIEERQQYLEGVLRAAPDAIVTLDAQHHIVEWNPGAERLFGYTEKEVIGRPLDDLVTNSDLRDEAIGFTHQVMAGDAILSLETVRFRKDGTPVDVILAGSPIQVGEQLVGAVAVYIDISERKHMERQLAHVATHDALTDLPNRTLFMDRLDMTIEQAQINQSKVAIMMLDLDRFKEVNDTLGHDVGDILLQAVGERLKTLLRSSDTVARMGGDEFMLILPNVVATENADSIAKKLLTSFQKPFMILNHELYVTLSIGIALCPEDGEDGETLIKNADIAMYRSKQRGRNQYQRFVTPNPDVNLEGT